MAARGSSHVRRRIAHWRRLTSALQVLVNTGSGGPELQAEAHSLRRQCELLSAALADLVHSRALAPPRLPQGAGQRVSTPPTAAIQAGMVHGPE